MDIYELSLATEPENPTRAHLVLGWDKGRGNVTDFGWDYLPQLGYAVRDPVRSEYTLYEMRDGLLYHMDEARALLLIDAEGKLIYQGQPRITTCHSVKPYIEGYV